MPAGAESKLTKSVIKEIAKSIGEAIPMKYAAMNAGIGPSTLQLWMATAKGKLPGATPLHLELLEQVTNARAKAVAVAMRQVNKAAKDNYKAAIWKLAMIDPDAFASEGKLIRELKIIVKKLMEGETS